MNQQQLQIPPYLIRKVVQPNSLRSPGGQTNDGHEYMGKNLILYLNKKIQDQRLKKKNNIININQQIKPTNLKKQHPKGFKIDIDDLKIKNDDKEYQKLDNILLSILDYYTYKDDIDKDENDENQCSYRGPFQEKNEFPEKLRQFIMLNMKEEQSRHFYEVYKREKLKDKIHLLGSKLKDYDFIKKKLVQQNNRNEQKDPKQEEYLLNIITKQENLTVGKVLQLDDENIQYKGQNEEQIKFVEDRKQGKMTAMEQLNELIDDQEIQDNKDIIKMYKETKLDDYDPQGSTKKKFKMLAFKKKNEKQQQLQEGFQQNQRNQMLNALRDPEQEPGKFLRPKTKHYSGPKNNVQVFSRLTQKNNFFSDSQKPSKASSPKTSRYGNNSILASQFGKSTDRGSLTTRDQTAYQSAPSSTRNNSSQKHKNIHVKESVLKETNFLKRCDSNFLEKFYDQKSIQQKILKHQKLGQKSESQRLTCILNNEQSRQQLKQLKHQFPKFASTNDEMIQLKDDLNEIDHVFHEGIKQMKQNQEVITQQMALGDPRFIAFKKEKVFKRDLIQFLINKVENKSDVVSKYVDKQWLDQFTKKIINSND